MLKTIYFAGGCFWGVEKFFSQFDGVKDTQVGYANGPNKAPTYEEVCSNSGHAETVKVDYNENIISLIKLIEYYFMIIDPLSINKQGNDIGIQYRTGIYYTTNNQLNIIKDFCEKKEKELGNKLAVEILPIKNFFPAEENHQKYLDKNPWGYCHIPKKLFKLNQEKKKSHEKEVRNKIGDLAYEVTQNSFTEKPFTGKYDNFFEKGIYVDIVSGEPLFISSDKFNSGCGWPAFSKPINKNSLIEKKDFSHFMVRTEVRSSKANSHLGHVFDDGPEDRGGLRYCINSAALRFVPFDEMEKEGYGEYKNLIGK